jgi:phosphatidate cytidylyltransferase
MPDQRDGDELFEDLDKFFAPIRDVDWDDDDAPQGQVPAEEHVEVQTAPPADERRESTQALPPIDPVEIHAAPEPDPDDDFQITTIKIDDDLVIDDGPAADPGSERAPEVSEPAPVGEGQADLASLFADEDDVEGLEAEVVEAEAAEAEAAEAEAAEAVEPVEVSFDESEPSEDDLEAAAAHFAGSLGDEATYETAPVQIIDEGSDLLAELGADEVEEDILSDLQEPSEAPRTVVVGAEGTTGPSWQDVAAVEVGADVERRSPGSGQRDLPAAFLTGLILAVVAIGALAISETAFVVVAVLGILVAQGELFGVMVRHHHQPATMVGLVGGALITVGAASQGEAAIPAMFALAVIATFVWFMAVPVTARANAMVNIGLTVLNLAWIPLMGAYLLATLDLPDGAALVIAIIGLTFVFDTFAFLVGSVWGGSFFQRALAPNVSPKKSVEGLIGATLVTVVIAAAVLPSFVDVLDGNRTGALALAIVIALAATLGDLAESLVKRDLGIKDMGSILPGHGGVLDRVDSLLFVAPAAYLALRVIL